MTAIHKHSDRNPKLVQASIDGLFWSLQRIREFRSALTRRRFAEGGKDMISSCKLDLTICTKDRRDQNSSGTPRDKSSEVLNHKRTPRLFWDGSYKAARRTA